MLPDADAWPRGYPESVGRYELLAPIGAGGMATVFLARSKVAGSAYREAAVKLLNPSFEGSPTDLLAEAELAAHVRHPHVVSVLGVEQEGPWTALVLDYVEGETVSGLLRGAGGALPLPIAGRILADALAGLHAAHETRVPGGESLHLVHRDFSPQNILVDVDGPARLTDFGVAKALIRQPATQSGVVKGKISYMAPEQVRGEPLDRRCDVWAAGVVAWEMLSGRRMHRHSDAFATMLSIAQDAPPRLRDERPDLPPALDEAVAWALTKAREQRCPTALALRQCLLEAIRGVGSIAEHDEVGAFVRRLAGPKLAERRSFAARTLAHRAEGTAREASPPRPSDSEAPTTATPAVRPAPVTDQAAPSVPAPVELETVTARATTVQVTSTATDDRIARRSGARRSLVIGGAAVLAVGALGATIFWGFTGRHESHPAAVDSAPLAPAEPARVVTASPPPEPPAPDLSAATSAPAVLPTSPAATTPAPRKQAPRKPSDDLLPFRKTPRQ